MLNSFFDYQHAHEAFFKQHGAKISYKKGQCLVYAHQESPWVHFLAEGYVNASFGFYDGSERLIGFFLPGMSFAKIGAFFDRDDGSLEYTAVTPVTVYRVPQSLFLEHLKKGGAFNDEYTGWLLKVQILLIERLVYLAQPTMRLRFLHWIAFMKRYYGEETIDNRCVISIPLTHEVIGGFLHVTRETSGRMIRSLVAQGLVRFSSKKLVIEDVSRLESML